MMRQPTVFVVDDDPRTREVVRDLTQMMNLGYESFNSGLDFVSSYDPSKPGCILLEIRAPGMTGMQVQEYLKGIGSVSPIIFLASRATVSIAVQAMRHGATHFVEKPFREHELWDVIQEAIQLDQRRRDARRKQDRLDARLGKLSERQRELMQMIAEGKTNREIAAKLGRCVRAIEKRRSELMIKLGTNSLLDLLHLALYARASNGPANGSGNGTARRNGNGSPVGNLGGPSSEMTYIF